MSTHAVTATYKGENVYLSAECAWPSRRWLLQLHLEEVCVSERGAELVARLAAADATLSDVRVQPAPP